MTTSRNDVDYVVTEYGAARLHGKTVRERMRASDRNSPSQLPRGPGSARRTSCITPRLLELAPSKNYMRHRPRGFGRLHD